MSLQREYGCSKIGATRKKAYTAAATTTIELVTYNGGVFSPASFAVKVSSNIYARQLGVTTVPTDMTLEFELLSSFIWRIDVDNANERYLHIKGMTAAGSIKITQLTDVSGTSSDLDA